MRLVLRHLRAGFATSVLVALLVAATVLVVALAPRALARLGTDELAYELRSEPAARIDLTGTAAVTLKSGRDAQSVLAPLSAVIAGIPGALPEPLAQGAGTPRWLVRTGTADAEIASAPTADLVARLAVDLEWEQGIRFVQGEVPATWPGPSDDAEEQEPPIGIAISEATAEAIGAQVGDSILVEPVPYVIAGIYAAVEPESGYWEHARDLLEPSIIREAGSPLTIQFSAFVAPDSLAQLREQFEEAQLTAWVPIDPDAFAFPELDLLGSQVRSVTSSPIGLPDASSLGLRSALADVFDAVGARVASTSALIALGGSGFLAVLVAAYALCIQAIVRRRRTVLALAAARGASPRQLRLVMVIEALLIVLPGSAVAMFGAALLVPESVGVAGWILPGVVAAIPVVLAAVLTVVSPRREVRDDLGARWSGPSRWVVELGVLLLAGTALLLLQRRGLVASSAAVGIDPLLSAVPVLLAVLAGLLVLRASPAPLRALHRALRRAVAPSASVGSARAVREPAIGLVGTLALVTGIGVAVFSSGMITTVAHGLEQSAREQLGADLQVTAHDLPSTLVDELEALPGVGTAVAIVTASGIEFSDESGPSEVTVLLADTQALHAVRPDLPAIGGKRDGALPVLVSSDWASRIDGGASLVNSAVTVAGVIPADALPGMSRNWLIVDASAAEELGLTAQVTRRILADLDGTREPAPVVAAATPLVVAEQPEGFAASARVDDAASLLARMRQAPVTGGLEISLVIVSAATLLLTMLILALAALTAAAGRNRAVAVLRMLGMSRRQVRGLIAWEFAPVAAGALVVGTAVGVALPFLVVAVLDLRAFFGGTSAPRPALDPVWIAATAGGFAIAVVIAIALATLAGRALAPAGALKMGDA